MIEEGLISWELEEERSEYGTKTFISQEKSIHVLEQGISELKGNSSCGQKGGAHSVRFLGNSIVGVMVSGEGVEGGSLIPS